MNLLPRKFECEPMLEVEVEPETHTSGADVEQASRSETPQVEEPRSPTNGTVGELRDRERILQLLSSIPIDFERLLDGVSRDVLVHPSHDGGWGMVEILPHMRDWEEVDAGRVVRTVTEEQPHLDVPDDSLWSIEHDYSSQDPLRAFAEFAELRNALVEHVSTYEADTWERTAVLDEIGEVTLHWILNDICNRDARHLDQAREALV